MRERVNREIHKSSTKRKKHNFVWKIQKLLISFELIACASRVVKAAPGPGKWPIIDLQYHSDGDEIDDLCERISENGITPSTAANVKQDGVYQYKFLWTGWVKLPAGMVMKRYDYDNEYHDVPSTVERTELTPKLQVTNIDDLTPSYSFVVNDQYKFDNHLNKESCYDYDTSNPAACNSAKACGLNKNCQQRCPKSLKASPPAICNQDPVKRCTTVGTEAWFFIGADYTILEPTGGETCKVEFRILRASPTFNDGAYGSTDCSDTTDSALRLHSAFSTDRSDPNSIITQDSDEIKLQPGYESITVKKRASAFIVLDKNHLYVQNKGNTGSDLEISLEDIMDYYQLNNFYYYLLAGEPTLFKYFDLTRWDPALLFAHDNTYLKGGGNYRKYMFEQKVTPYGYKINYDLTESDYTGLSTSEERRLYLKELNDVIDFEAGHFCFSTSSTLTIRRLAADSLNSDGSNSIRIKHSIVIFQGADAGLNYNDVVIVIKRNGPNVNAYLEIKGSTSSFSTTSGADFGVDGEVISQVSYPSSWPGQGYVELMVFFTVCPTDRNLNADRQYVPMLASFVLKDSELPSQTFSSRPAQANVLDLSDKFSSHEKKKTLGLRFEVLSSSASNDLDFFVTNMVVYRGGTSPTMIDVITTDTTTYPDYTYWDNHFLGGTTIAFMGGSRTNPDGSKHPDDKIFIPRCTNSEPKSFVKGDQGECLVSETIPGCLKYRADLTDESKGVCERCDYENGYWLDKSNPDGVCEVKVENPGVEVNCDADTHNHYEVGECHSCFGVQDGCLCNSNQAQVSNGTCTCDPPGCNILIIFFNFFIFLFNFFRCHLPCFCWNRVSILLPPKCFSGEPKCNG